MGVVVVGGEADYGSGRSVCLRRRGWSRPGCRGRDLFDGPGGEVFHRVVSAAEVAEVVGAVGPRGVAMVWSRSQRQTGRRQPGKRQCSSRAARSGPRAGPGPAAVDGEHGAGDRAGHHAFPGGGAGGEGTGGVAFDGSVAGEQAGLGGRRRSMASTGMVTCTVARIAASRIRRRSPGVRRVRHRSVAMSARSCAMVRLSAGLTVRTPVVAVRRLVVVRRGVAAPSRRGWTGPRRWRGRRVGGR